MSERGYSGWANWETWNVALWCDSVEAIYRDRMQRKPLTPAEVEEFVRDWFPDGTPDMVSSDTNHSDAYAAREVVDWREIAAHWVED